MASGLRDPLSAIHAIISDNITSVSVSKTHELVGDIGQICLQEVTSKDIDLCSSLLFDKDTGICAFLRSTIQHEEFVDCKAEVLEMLLAVMQKFPKQMLSYLVDIKDASMSAFRRERLAKVRGSALGVLVEVIKQSSGASFSDELQIPKLAEMSFMELSKSVSKLPTTVKSLLFEYLGVIAEVYPEHMMIYAERLQDIYMRTLKLEMQSKTKKPDFSLIAGCLRGLTHLLVNFTQSAAEGSKYAYDIYRCCRNAIDPDLEYTRYSMPKAGLELMAKHAGQFDEYLLEDYEVLYSRLSAWSRHNNRETAHRGMLALEAFLTQVALSLVEMARAGKRNAPAFKYFIQHFHQIMDDPQAGRKEVALAIRGYGFFAAPCKLFLSADDVKLMLTHMMQRSEQIYFSGADTSDDRLISLSHFLEALASIIKELDETPAAFLVSLERLVVLQMETIPQLHKKLHFIGYAALVHVIQAVGHRGNDFKGFISRIVYQGLIRTCSHAAVLETEEQVTSDSLDGDEEDERNRSKITYKDHLPMWEVLLNPNKLKDKKLGYGDQRDAELIASSVYHELIASILKMTDRLDLTADKTPLQEAEGSQVDDDLCDPATSDPIQGLHAHRPRDFVIFINLVDFCRDFLTRNNTSLFSRWVFTFGHQIILFSTKSPLVSGFYKLLAIAMKICGKIHYFKGFHQLSAPQTVKVKEEVFTQDMDTEKKYIKTEDDEDTEMEAAGDAAQRHACFLLFSKFAKEVLERMKQYKDDLLAACLLFILSLPKEIVAMEISAIVPALQKTLEMGRSYLPLANIGLDALELWSKTLPQHIIMQHYPAILPCLDPYLSIGSIYGETQGTVSVVSKNLKKKHRRKKIPVKLLKQSHADSVESGQLEHVRERCVYLLGSLGGSINHLMVNTSGEDIAKQAVAWDTTQHLKFTVPFRDIKPTIYLDPFLPRVVELATSSADRQTKVAACELLHSLVLYMLGRSSQQPGGAGYSFSMQALYRCIFPSLLQLACDVEQVAKELFESLLFQLIHWFSGSKAYESEETMALLDAFMAGIVSPTDTAVRDLSARCLKEFLTWSIKHTAPKQLEKSPRNVKSLLKRLYSLARHPNAYKRLGAALTFNNIYTVFREESSLVDQFSLELLVVFIDSLALAHHDDHNLGTQEQCRKALMHLERILSKFSALFNKESKNRRKPRSWLEANMVTCVRWLLRQCGRPQTECRHVCMELVCKLAPAITGANVAKDFFDSVLSNNGAAYFIQRFEGSLYKTSQTKQGLLRYPVMSTMGDHFTVPTALAWFDLLLAALDCYTWVIGEGLLSPAQVLVVSGNKGTSLFQVLGDFFTNLAMEDIEGAAKLFDNRMNGVVFTPNECDAYNKAKCTVLVRTMNFFCVCYMRFAAESQKVVPTGFWSTAVMEAVLMTVLQPQAIGFNMADVEVMNKLPEQTTAMLQVIKRFLGDKLKSSFTKLLQDKLTNKGACDLWNQLPVALQDSCVDVFDLSQLVAGFHQLQNAGLLTGCLGRPSKQMAEKLLDNVVQALVVLDEDGAKMTKSLTPVSHDLACAMLKLAVAAGLEMKRLVSCLLDKASVRTSVSGAGASSHIGSHFYDQYKVVINECIINNMSAAVPCILTSVKKEWSIITKVLTNVMDYVIRDRDIRKRLGRQVTEAVLKQWGELSCLWQPPTASVDSKNQMISLLTKIVIIDSHFISEGQKHSSFTPVYTVYLSLLADKATSLGFKARVLDLLPFFATLPSKENTELKNTLNSFVADNFPVVSTEYPSGSSRFNDYITALNKLLTALDLSGSLSLLELIISIMCKEKHHVHEDEIQNSISRFVKRLAKDKQKPALDVPYSIFVKEGSFKSEQRRAALERVCLSMLRLVHPAALTEFFNDHIKAIMTSIESKPVKAPEVAMETQVTTKLGCWQLLEVMYSRLPKQDVNSKDSSINRVYCSPKAVDTGKEMNLAITKAAQAARSEDMRGETSLLELRRQYHCAAYNTLIAVMVCTQNQLKFFTSFIFTENIQKGQMLWDNLVDPNKVYEFAVEMEAPLARRKRFVSIRSEHREQVAALHGDRVGQSVHYMASQYLADSSLSADVGQFDFSTSAASSRMLSPGATYSSDPGHDGSVALRRKSSAKETSIEASEVKLEEGYVEMEMDELNQHECIASLTALVKHLQANQITPAVEKGVTPASLPDWMSQLHRKFSYPDTHTNVQLFIAKLIVNAEEVFRPYAKFWLAPLVQLVTRQGLAGPEMHYFKVDIIVTMLSWSTAAIPEDNAVDRAMTARLVDYVVTHCHHENRRVMRNNLEVLKTLVEVWRSRIEVPTKTLFENFTEKDTKSKRNGTGLQLVAVFVANKIPAFRPHTGVDKDRFYQYLAMNMTMHYKATYGASAEVVGMVLQLMTDTERGSEHQQWRDTYLDNISKMLMGIQASKPDQFITCVHSIHKHHAPAADRFLAKMLFMLPKMHGEFRTLILEILHSRLDRIENAFLELKNKDFVGFLTHRDDAVQHISLKLLLAMLPKLEPVELNYLLSSAASTTTHSSASCRTVMFDILMWIYDSYRHRESNEVNDKILSLAKEELLKGLSDSDMKIRLTVQNFWSHETRLPEGTLDRMVAMLEAMYSPSSEAHYLSYATNLLLEMTSKSPDFSREIFEHPLSECKFQDHRVNAAWRQRHAAMTPLFVETQASSPVEESMATSSGAHQLRATQEVVQFTATQAAGSNAPFNWLTQSSLDTQAEQFNLTLNTQSESSLLFTIGSSTDKQKANKRIAAAKPGEGFGKGHLGGGPSKDATDGKRQESTQTSDILRLKKRFVKDAEATKIYFMKRAQRLKKMEVAVREEQKKHREHHVTMYRQYRIGDLPDIQIKYSAIIAPLQALAQKDSMVGRLLFSAVFRAIFAEIESEKTDREAREMTEKVKESLNNMLANSTTYYPQFVSCILDIPQDDLSKKLAMDAGNVATASVTSATQPLGVLLLEEMLIKAAESTAAEPPSKRARGNTGERAVSVVKDTPRWVELARLYKSMGDYDVLQGIFSSRIGTASLSRNAMEAEMRQDYQTAIKLYSEGLSGERGEALDVEVDMWEEARMECCKRLTQWERLESFIGEELEEGRLDVIWDNTYYQEHYLPAVIESKLRRLLEGDDSQQQLLSFIDEALAKPERKDIIESQFSSELALLYIYQEDYDRARHYARLAVQAFLQKWSSYDRLMVSNRAESIQTVQMVTELHEFLQFMAKESSGVTVASANHLVDTWLRRSPHPLLDNQVTWDSNVLNRCLFLDKISMLLETKGAPEDDLVVFEKQKVLMRLAQADAACKQNNFPVALKQMKITRAIVKDLDSDVLQTHWSHSYARIHCRKCEVTSMTPEEKVTALTGAYNILCKNEDRGVLNATWKLNLQQQLIQGNMLGAIADTLRVSEDLDIFSGSKRDKLLLLASCGENADKEEVISSLTETGYNRLKAAVMVTREHENDGEDQAGICEAHMALVTYCDQILRNQESDEKSDQTCPSQSNFPTTMVLSLLTAMRLNSRDARLMFPRLLQIVDLYPDTISTFISSVAKVPVWMVLCWIGQITALLDKPESPAIQDLLTSVAELYPNALIYPFKMSSEGYDFTNNAVGRKSKICFDKIKALLSSNKIVENFIVALEQFSQPDALFKDWYQDGELKRLMEKPRQNSRQIQQLYLQMYRELVDISASEASLYSVGTQKGAGTDSLAGMGPYREQFAQKYQKKMDDLFGKTGNKLVAMSLKDFGEKCKKLYETMDLLMRKSLTPPGTLKEYSTWLANFQGSERDQQLEIPGQYLGLGKPLPEYHTMISSFDERVKCLSSIRKPKCITIRGNDEKEYRFLVKGGEDLRQDQRIEQVFDLMNDIYSRDSACRQRQLRIRTYSVTPMTPRVGLIEWMDNTTTLKSFLEDALTKEEKKFLDSQRGPKSDHYHWIGDKKSVPHNYHDCYKRYNRTDTENAFRRRENAMPWDLSRRAYLKMAASQEAFFLLRTNFATSHAQLCISQYILGIGDRHLSNHMIDTCSGKMVAIDFGHAFGSATQFLPVPELIPFRMTRQLRNLMLPLREKGLIEGTMVHCLQSLRNESRLLLNMMDVFIKEPSLDWKQNAMKQVTAMTAAAAEEIEELEGDMEWYPRQKVEYARRKLVGYNPCYITRDELKLGHAKHSHCRNYESVVMGDKEVDIRAQLPQKGLTAKQQVACLLNQATDPNILGRMYIGWESWV